jgi:hypothetical protein
MIQLSYVVSYHICTLYGDECFKYQREMVPDTMLALWRSSQYLLKVREMLNWVRMCVPWEWEHACLYSGIRGKTVLCGPPCAKNESNISYKCHLSYVWKHILEKCTFMCNLAFKVWGFSQPGTVAPQVIDMNNKDYWESFNLMFEDVCPMPNG